MKKQIFKRFISLFCLAFILVGWSAPATTAHAGSYAYVKAGRILNANKKQIGVVTLSFNTKIAGGRPQFIYNDYWYDVILGGYDISITITKVTFTGDGITFNISYNDHGTKGTTSVYITPYT